MDIADAAGRDESTNVGQSILALQYAGLGRRFIAFLIDMFVTLVLVWLVTLIVGLALGIFGYSTRAGDVELVNRYRQDPGAGFRIMVTLAYIVYFTFMEARGGATLGKRLLHLRVATEFGEPINWRSSLVRNLLRPFDILGGFLFALRGRHQRLGDRAAHTVVVRI